MDKKLHKSLNNIIDYLQEEKDDYLDNGKPKGHIYEDIMVVWNWMKKHPVKEDSE